MQGLQDSTSRESDANNPWKVDAAEATGGKKGWPSWCTQPTNRRRIKVPGLDDVLVKLVTIW